MWDFVFFLIIQLNVLFYRLKKRVMKVGITFGCQQGLKLVSRFECTFGLGFCSVFTRFRVFVRLIYIFLELFRVLCVFFYLMFSEGRFRGRIVGQWLGFVGVQVFGMRVFFLRYYLFWRQVRFLYVIVQVKYSEGFWGLYGLGLNLRLWWDLGS